MFVWTTLALLACNRIDLGSPEALEGQWYSELSRGTDDAPDYSWQRLSVWDDTGTWRYELDHGSSPLGYPDADGIERGVVHDADGQLQLVTQAGQLTDISVVDVTPGEELVFTGILGDQQVHMRASSHCAAPGQWQTVGLVSRHFNPNPGSPQNGAAVAWSPTGDLFVGGESAWVSDQHSCSLRPITAFPAASALAIERDGTGVALEWTEEGRFLIHEFDSLAPDTPGTTTDIGSAADGASFRTELATARRPDGTAMFLTNGGQQIIQRDASGTFKVTPGVPHQGGLIGQGADLAAHPDGRLLVRTQHYLAQYYLETAAGSGQFEPLEVPEHRTAQHSDDLQTLFAYDADGTLWAAWSQWFELDRPDRSYETAAADALWVGRLVDGEWERFDVGAGDPFGLEIVDGEVRVAFAVHRDTFVFGMARLHTNTGEIIETVHTTDWPSPTAGSTYVSMQQTEYTQIYPRAAFGPSGQVAFQGVTWTHGNFAEVPKKDVPITFSGDGTASVSINGVTCDSDCTVPLAAGVGYPVVIDSGVDSAVLSSGGLSNPLVNVDERAYGGGYREATWVYVDAPWQQSMELETTYERLRLPTPLHALTTDGLVTGAVSTNDGFTVGLYTSIECGDGSGSMEVVAVDPSGTVTERVCTPGVVSGKLWQTDAGVLIDVGTQFGTIPNAGGATTGRSLLSGTEQVAFGWSSGSVATELTAVIDGALVDYGTDAQGYKQLITYANDGSIASQVEMPYMAPGSEVTGYAMTSDGDNIIFLFRGNVHAVTPAGDIAWSLLNLKVRSLAMHDGNLTLVGRGGSIGGGAFPGDWIATVDGSGEVTGVVDGGSYLLTDLQVAGDALFSVNANAIRGDIVRLDHTGVIDQTGYSVNVGGAGFSDYQDVELVVLPDGDDFRIFTGYIGGYQNAGWWADFGNDRLLPTAWPTAWTGRYRLPETTP